MKKYWTSEVYGFGKWIRKYGFYPNWLPLCINVDHGIPLDENPAKHEIESDAPVFFSYWHIKTQRFREIYNRQCYTFLSPFVFARKSLKIEQSENAKGSLFFVSHSSQDVISQKTVDEYCQELSGIPEIFKPLTVCLHTYDVDRGLDREFQKLGYQVVTAGNNLEPLFTENFYRILENYNYTISDSIGSQTFYSIEMGIPFGLFGEEPKYLNFGDPNIEIGEYTSYERLEAYQKAISLFSGLPTKITIEQKEFVEEHIGINYGLSRTKFAFILYKSLLIWLSNLENRKEFIAACIRKLRFYKKTIANKVLDFSLRKLLNKIGFKGISKENAQIIASKEIEKFVITSDYNKIKELPRYTFTQVNFLGKQLGIVDNASFVEMTKEIFVRNIYDFNSNDKSPYIIDCGANIGLSVIYFKRLYPESQIVAIEADPSIYKVLKQNIESYKFENVQCINSAVWINSEDSLNFSVEGSWGGYLSSVSQVKEHSIIVKSMDLRKLINRKVDLLKIDIEGAESEVLLHAQHLIVEYVDHLFFEWHSLREEKQRLGEILSYFENRGFRYHIKESANRETPFTNKPTTRMDSQLDCFLYKV